jgi:hypothetical protein
MNDSNNENVLQYCREYKRKCVQNEVVNYEIGQMVKYKKKGMDESINAQILKIHSEEEGGGVTIYIPETKREVQTLNEYISQPFSNGNCESLKTLCNYQKDMKKELNQLIKSSKNNKRGGKSRKKRMRFGRRKKVTKKRMTSNRKKNKKIRK